MRGLEALAGDVPRLPAKASKPPPLVGICRVIEELWMNINNSHITYLPLLVIAYLSGCATSLPETASIPPTTPLRSALAQENLEGNLESSKEIITAKKIVVEIYNKSGNSGGTGFIIEVLNNRVYILTAAHLIEGNSQPKVNIFSQGDYNARVLRVDEQRNLALLVVENEDLSATTTPYYLPENNELTTTGNVIFTIGFPKAGKLWAYQKLSYAGTQNEHLLFTGDLIEEGNSGGPVVSETKIIGMIAGKSEKVYAISSRVIRSFLQSISTEGPAILAKHDKRQSAAVVVTKGKATNLPQGPANKSATQATTVAGKAVKPPVKAADKTAKASGTGVATPASTTPPVAPQGKDTGATPVTSSDKKAVVATQEKAKVVTPIAKPSDSATQVTKESVIPPVTATTPKAAPASPVTATSPPKMATVTTGTTTSKSVTPLVKQPDSAAPVKTETAIAPVTTPPKSVPATGPATATSPPKTATATTGATTSTTSKSATPSAKPPDAAPIKKEAVTAKSAKEPVTAKSAVALKTPMTKTNTPQKTTTAVTGPAGNSLQETALKTSPQPTEKAEPKTESASLSAMCTAIVTDNMDNFRKEAKLLKKNSNLSYLASNVIQALALQDRKTVLEHSLKFLFEAFLLSHDAKDSTCSPLLLKLKADELDALKRASKKK